MSYREKIALSPDATVVVRLLDVSRADAPATTITEHVITSPGQVPIEFKLDYSPGDIDSRSTYVVRAEIMEGEQLVFTTDTSYPVITQGNPTRVELQLVSAVPSPTALDGTAWTLVSLAGTDVLSGTEITAEFDGGTLSGSAGCNSYSGQYTAEGGTLSVHEKLAVTARACEAPILDQESAYLAALTTAGEFQINNDRLTLTTGEGSLEFQRAGE